MLITWQIRNGKACMDVCHLPLGCVHKGEEPTFNMAHNAGHQWCIGFPTRPHFLRVTHFPESASQAGNPAYTYESMRGIHIQTTASET